MICNLATNCEEIDYTCLCSLSPLFNLLGSKWIPELITLFGHHTRLRFGEIAQLLDHISPTVLTEKLKQLEQLGYLTRIEYQEHPPRVEYTFSDTGIYLWERVRELLSDTRLL